MNILVIGGTGLMSTEIVRQLVDRGDSVTVYNRGITEKRIPAKVRTMIGNRWDYPEFEKSMAQERFDAVIDMVAYDPANIESVLRAFKGRTSQIVVCSTVCVYGGPLTKMPADDNEPHRFATEYGRKKSAIEKLLLKADGVDGLHTTVIRPSFTTGEGVVLTGVLFDETLVSRIRKGLPVIVHGEGTTRWAVAHAADVARGFVNTLANSKAYGQAYHLTSDEHTNWDGVYEAIGRAAGRKPDVVHIPVDWLSEVAPRRSVGVKYIYQYDSVFDNSKARKDLDFRTTVPLTEIFQRQIEWMEESGKLVNSVGDNFEDIWIKAFQNGRHPDQAGWSDENPWGNEPTT